MKFNNWVLQPDKYLNKEQTSRLLETLKHRAKFAEAKGKKTAIRDYFIIHLTLSTGLRVMEVSMLKCGDLFLDDKTCSVMVRKGKCNKQRLVFFTNPLKRHCKEYLCWKKKIGESIKAESPLIVSTNTGYHMTTRALQKAFKRSAKKACLNSKYAIHCLRHTYACFLLKASNWNLRLVQKQLGHSKITTTQVYADVMMPDIEKALDRLYL